MLETLMLDLVNNQEFYHRLILLPKGTAQFGFDGDIQSLIKKIATDTSERLLKGLALMI